MKDFKVKKNKIRLGFEIGGISWEMFTIRVWVKDKGCVRMGVVRSVGR